MEYADAHEAFNLIRNSLLIPKLLYTFSDVPTFRRSDILTLFDEAIRSTRQKVLKVHLDEQTWQQLGNNLATNLATTDEQTWQHVKCTGMGIHNVTELSTSAFLSSVSKSQALFESIIKTGLPKTDVREAADKWWLLVGEDESAPDSDDQKKQKKWYESIAENRLRELENVSTEQDNFRLQGAKCRGSGDWINTLPSSTLKLKLIHEQFRNASSLRLGATISSPYTCVCGAQADVKGIHV